jgi:AraC-like DNA-binding protein
MNTDSTWTNYSRRRCADSFGPIELLTAVALTQPFPRHYHEDYVVEVVEEGVDEFFCCDAMYRAPAGSIVLINPHEIHTGASVGVAPLSYRSLYPTPALLAWIASQMGDRACAEPHFASRVVSDGRLAQRLCRAHRALEIGADRLVGDTLLLDALSELIKCFANRKPPVESAGLEPAAVRRAREYMLDHLSDNIRLDHLAVVCGLSPFHLLRVFRNHIGLAPHEFLLNARIERAKSLLNRGQTLAQTAYELGFSDQSHFTRHFKRIVGVTPGRFLANSNFMQDLPSSGMV